MQYQEAWDKLRLQAQAQLNSRPMILKVLNAPVLKKALNYISQWKGDARWLAIWFCLCLSIAVLYILITPPEYNSSTLVILEPRRPFSSSPIADASLIQTNLDNSQVESQIQIVKSEQVLKFVFKELNLQSDPEFIGQPSLIRRFFGAIFGTVAPNVALARDEAIAFPVFADRVSVRRIGQSLVLEISYRSRSASRAASIANSITAAFIRDQIESKALSMRRNGEWLQGRIDEIKAQEDASVNAVRKGGAPSMQFSASDARIISSANVPLSKSFPQSGLLLMFAGAFALLTGFGVISVRHSFDRKIRTKDQLNQEFGLDCLCVIPRIEDTKVVGNFKEFLSYCVSEKGSTSAFSESLRSLRTTLLSKEQTNNDLNKKPVRIGVISCFKNEGKTSVASNLAYVLAASNQKTILADIDFKNSDLTKNLLQNDEVTKIYGVSSLLQEKIRPALISKVRLGNMLEFIPAINSHASVNPNLFVDPNLMQGFFQQFTNYDYVIVDLPAISLSADVSAISPALDALIIVIEAGRTSFDDITEALQVLHSTNTKILGVVLNKAAAENLPRLQRA